MPRFHYYTLDVFTDRPFGGNPLAVVLDADGLPGTRMQAIAAEFNLSETVFVLRPDGPRGTRKLRIFTPRAELPFAGHPTIGASFLLAWLGLAPCDAAHPEMVLEEGIGDVPVTVRFGADGPVATRMAVPKMPEPGPLPPDANDLAAMLSLGAADLLPGHPPRGYGCGVPFLFLPLRDREAMGRIRLRNDLWEKHLATWWAPSVFAFCFDTASAHARIHARMFAPALGVAEDPATGSAAAALAGYLCEREAGEGVFRWPIEQGIEMGRPSLIELDAEKRGGRVVAVGVGGRSVPISEGWIDPG